MIKRAQLQVKLQTTFEKIVKRSSNTPLMTILFATSTSLLLYQNCSVAEQSASESSSKQSAYSSTIGGYTGGTVGTGSGGAAPISAMPGGGAVPIPGGSGGTGNAGGGATPIDTGGGTGTGGTGVSPGGSTGGASMGTFVWQYQPEDRTAEEGEVLTLSSYATKGVDLVTYQWYKNGVALTGQTGYMYRAFLIPLSAAGNYYVVARSGTETIQSMTVAVKVKAARNACAAGRYGVYPGTKNYDEYWHESMIGRTNAPHGLQRELADGYTIRMPYSGATFFNGNECVAATAIFQCRNGKLVSTEQLTCTQYRDTSGGA